MTGSVILDVIIGLVFIFLLYSLLATIIQEMIASKLSFRAKILEKAIIRMLQDGNNTSTNNIIKDRSNSFLHLLSRKNLLKGKPFASWFYTHPIIKYAAEDNCYSKPAYISANNFSKVILDLLHGIAGSDMNTLRVRDAISNGYFHNFLPNEADSNHPATKALLALDADNKKLSIQKNISTKGAVSTTPIDQETLLNLQSLWLHAGGDLEQFKKGLEQWFEDTMKRAAGWYQRYTRFILFFIGLFIAISFNVDTLGIAKQLAKDPELRAQILKQTESYMATQKDLSYNQQRDTNTENKKIFDQALKDQQELMNTANSMIRNEVNNLNMVLGLGYKDYKKIDLYFLSVPILSFANIIGLILTALAISLGAPFWFDLLNKMMKLRNSTKTTPEASIIENAVGKSNESTSNIKGSISNNGEEAIG